MNDSMKAVKDECLEHQKDKDFSWDNCQGCSNCFWLGSMPVCRISYALASPVPYHWHLEKLEAKI